MISDRGDFYFRDWMNSLSVGPLSFVRFRRTGRLVVSGSGLCRESLPSFAKGKSVRREGPAYCCAMKASRRLTAAADASSLG